MKVEKLTKIDILSGLASMYDPISLISLTHLLGKLLCREICDLKFPWNETVPPLVKQKWERRKLEINNNRVKIPIYSH